MEGVEECANGRMNIIAIWRKWTQNWPNEARRKTQSHNAVIQNKETPTEGWFNDNWMNSAKYLANHHRDLEEQQWSVAGEWRDPCCLNWNGGRMITKTKRDIKKVGSRIENEPSLVERVIVIRDPCTGRWYMIVQGEEGWSCRGLTLVWYNLALYTLDGVEKYTQLRERLKACGNWRLCVAQVLVCLNEWCEKDMFACCA